MRKILLIAGPGGVGKSTLVAQFSEKFFTVNLDVHLREIVKREKGEDCAYPLSWEHWREGDLNKRMPNLMGEMIQENCPKFVTHPMTMIVEGSILASDWFVHNFVSGIYQMTKDSDLVVKRYMLLLSLEELVKNLRKRDQASDRRKLGDLNKLKESLDNYPDLIESNCMVFRNSFELRHELEKELN